jgi:hypothetical protein
MPFQGGTYLNAIIARFFVQRFFKQPVKKVFLQKKSLEVTKIPDKFREIQLASLLLCRAWTFRSLLARHLLSLTRDSTIKRRG